MSNLKEKWLKEMRSGGNDVLEIARDGAPYIIRGVAAGIKDIDICNKEQLDAAIAVIDERLNEIEDGTFDTETIKTSNIQSIETGENIILRSRLDFTNNTIAGTVGTGITRKTYGTGGSFVTMLTFSNVSIGNVTVEAPQAFNKLLFTFPAGVHITRSVYLKINILSSSSNQEQTSIVAIGSTGATGEISVLNGDPSYENYIVSQTTPDIGGTDIEDLILYNGDTADFYTVSKNLGNGSKSVYINVAQNWNASSIGSLTATGTVVIMWDKVV